ncbi:hypothetical protein BKA69DRAFT_86943 [Paraphysoderma sedebokerense]|nr:hypothetical protein BKA69DRAFT_86943 [Paraphysoderma sedebokerense]
MRQNRLYRDQQYEIRRQKDYEEAIQREYELSEQQRREYNVQTELQLLQHYEILEKKKMDKRKKYWIFCKGLVDQVIQMALKIAEYRTLNEGSVPPKVLREWKSLLLSGKNLQNVYELDVKKDGINIDTITIQLGKEQVLGTEQQPPVSEQNVEITSDRRCEPVEGSSEVLEGINLLDEQEFFDYIKGTGEWVYREQWKGAMPETNAELGRLVSVLIDITAPPEQPIDIPKLPGSPLKMAVIGKRFSGKKSIAKSLSELYGISMLSVDEVVDDAIKAAQAKETVVFANGETVPSIRARLGQEAQSTLMSGTPLDDALLVSLVVDRIRQITIPANDSKSSGPSPKSNGWILINFPRNRNQAALLEREMTGYEDQKPVKYGNLKRNGRDGSSQKRSLIAPPIESKPDAPISGTTTLASGLDAVLLLDVANEIAVKRAAGRRLDPVTGTFYHMEFDPPPLNAPGIHERLISVEDEANFASQLQFHLNQYDEAEVELKEWFNKFSNLKIIDANSNKDVTWMSVKGVVSELITKKAEAKDTTIQHESIQTGTEGAEASTNVKTEDSAKPVESPVQIAAEHKASPPNIEIKSGDKKSRPSTGTSTKQNASIANLIRNDDKGIINSQISIKDSRSFSTAKPITTVVVKKQPSKQLAEVLADQWATIESSFTDATKFVFRSLRRERKMRINYFFQIKATFKEFLQRPDNKQALLSAFQKDFNNIEEDLRSDPDTKAELHQRAEDLREKLWEISDRRKEEAEAERMAVIEDKWVEDHFAVLGNLFITLMQVEVNRFLGTKQLILDYYKDLTAMPLDESNVKPLTIPKINHQVNLSIHLSVPGSGRSKTRNGNSSLSVTGIHSRRPSIQIAAPQNQRSNASLTEKHDDIADEALFADIFAAHQLALNIVPAENQAAQFDDPAKRDPLTTSKTLDRKKADAALEAQKETNSSEECSQAIKYEEQLLRLRLDRIKQQALLMMKELRSKAVEAYIQMDSWIGNKFRDEMDAIRDMLAVIKDAVELETRIANELTLDGEKFKVEHSILTFEPEPEPRPESPIEKPVPDQFTILQLLNLCHKFRKIAAPGVISTKFFVEGLHKLALAQVGHDYLPDSFISADASAFQQITAVLDPYSTGFVNWRKFLVIAARIMPNPSVEYVSGLKKLYMRSASFLNGTISKTDFLSVPLWFEHTSEELDNEKRTKFNRSAKLKLALFEIFALDDHNANKPTVTQDINDIAVDTNTERYSTTVNESSTKFARGIQDNDSRLFDTRSFLFCCCLDEHPKISLQKAFRVFAETDGSDVTLSQLFEILHFGTPHIEVTSRATASLNEDPYSMDVLKEIFKAMKPSTDNSSSISFQEYIRLTHNESDVASENFSQSLSDTGVDNRNEIVQEHVEFPLPLPLIYQLEGNQSSTSH